MMKKYDSDAIYGLFVSYTIANTLIIVSVIAYLQEGSLEQQSKQMKYVYKYNFKMCLW